MTPERQQQIKQLFHEAREQAPEARASFLDEACRGDAALRDAIDSLLRAYEQLDGFIQAPIAAAPTVEQAVLESGQMVGHYCIERQLGAGGMGVVYLARDTRLGRLVTLKLLHSRYTQNRERMRRFQQEARAASALNHPNILTIYEVGQAADEAGGGYYIVAEYVQGQTLRELFRTDTLQLGQALDLGLQILAAMVAAHQAGIVHRDIKPDNIMQRPDGIVKVLDFGLAKLTEDAQRSPEFTTITTQPGLVMGTVAYMSPEQARGVEVDARSDLFSVGVVLYELLSGRKPFQGETPSDVLAALLEREPPPLTHYISGLPSALEQVVSRALAKVPEERYQTAQEFSAALKALKTELEMVAHLSRSVSQENALTMRVGVAAQADEVTRRLVISTAQQTAPPLSQLRWQARIKPLVFGIVALLLLLAGLWLGRNRWITPAAALDSVAVLPFLNVGNDPQTDYLPDGITMNLIDSLSELPALRKVMARDTVFTYKGRQVDPRQIGKDLNVRAVVIGRVQYQGDRLRIRVELVDTADGAQLWSEEYEQPVADLLKVQREIVRKIITALRLRLSGEQLQPPGKRYSEDVEAYRLYLLGRYHFYQYSQEGGLKALAYFKQAIARDPKFALAYTGVADHYTAFSSRFMAPREAMPLARQAARTALDLDNNLAEAHLSIAYVKIWGDWDWNGAEQEFQRAIELNPNLVAAHSIYGDMLAKQGRFEEALREAKRAQEIDPLAPYPYERMGVTLYYMRQYDRAMEQFRKAIDLDPEQLWSRYSIGILALQTRQYQAAITELEKSLSVHRSDALLSILAQLYSHTGRHNEARKLLAALQEQARQRWVTPVYLADIYLALGDKEHTFELLQQAEAEHSEFLHRLRVDPLYDSLRSDPRFTTLIRNIGLTP